MSLAQSGGRQQAGHASEYVDVLIVGAGVSGIGCAYHLQREQPGRSYVILEAREATGGTWDLFRYPGIRSDSDLHTFGYEFKPWVDEKSIADGTSILRYIRETVSENGMDPHIRLGHLVTRASWSSERARWLVTATRTDTGEEVQIACSWLFCAGGYYRYDRGHTPAFEGRDRFQGPVIHPQQWPADLDYEGRRVVVIGSGATAVTLVPALSRSAAHVTMLQRSPTYVISVPEKDPVANVLGRWLAAPVAYSLARRKNIWLQRTVYSLSRSHPRLVRWVLRALVKRQLPPGYDVDTHFKPRYDPWDQRLCAVPDGDLFRAISAGRAEVVTGEIDRFTDHGILLLSGEEVPADIIITATGLEVLAFGGIQLCVDGRDVDLPSTIAYRAMMLSDVPNFAFAIGYTNSSWTLKVDLVCEHLGRLLGYMRQHGFDTCTPHNDDPALQTHPLLDFGAGYVRRAVDRLPRQGDRPPWSLPMSYREDVQNLRHAAIDDPCLAFSTGRRAGADTAAPSIDATPAAR